MAEDQAYSTEPEEAYYSLSESALADILTHIGAIERPTVAYGDDQLTMANDVIAAMQSRARRIRSLLPKVD